MTPKTIFPNLRYFLLEKIIKNIKICQKIFNFFLLILEGILNIHTKNLVKIQGIFETGGMRASDKNQGIFKTGGIREPPVKIKAFSKPEVLYIP